MGEFILPQLEPFCKVQNNPNVNATIKIYSKSSDPYRQQCARILSMGNDAAVEFLEGIGFTKVIPGTHFIPLYEVADFFEIDADTLYAYLTRHGFGANRDPRESITEDLASFFRRAGFLRHGHFVTHGHLEPIETRYIFDYQFSGTDIHYQTAYKYSGRLFSARAYLSTLPFIYRWFAKKRPGKKYVAIYEKLMGYLAAFERKKMETAEKEAARKQAEVEAQKAIEEPKNNGTTLSKDELMSMIKQAVREVLADARVEVPATFTITT